MTDRDQLREALESPLSISVHIDDIGRYKTIMKAGATHLKLLDEIDPLNNELLDKILHDLGIINPKERKQVFRDFAKNLVKEIINDR